MKIKYSKKALKFLAKQEKANVARIRQGIAGLTQNPAIGDIKPMEGYNDGTMRLRVGTFRIIYNYAEKIEKDEDGEEQTIEILLIIDIGNRGDIYK